MKNIKKIVSILALLGGIGFAGSAWAWDGTVNVPNVAGGTTPVSCTGVAAAPKQVDGQYVFIYQNTSSSGTLTLPLAATVQYLVVGGGGSGGKPGTTGIAGKSSGGGNAGGVSHAESQSLVAGKYTMTVGAGGEQTSSVLGGGTGNSGAASSLAGPSGSGVNVSAAAGEGGSGAVGNGSSKPGTGNAYSSSITGTSVTYAQAGPASTSSSSGQKGATPGSGGQGAYNSGSGGAGADGIVVIRIKSIAADCGNRSDTTTMTRAGGAKTLTCSANCSATAASWSIETVPNADVATVELVNSTSTTKPQAKVTPKGPGRTTFVAKNNKDGYKWTVTVVVTDVGTTSVALKSDGASKNVTVKVFGDASDASWSVAGVDSSKITVSRTSGTGLEFSTGVSANMDEGTTSFTISCAYITYTVNVEVIEAGIASFTFQGATIKYTEGAGYDKKLGDDHVLVLTNTAAACALKLPSPYLFRADVLAVAGGGGGGCQTEGQGGGGGGAGGYDSQTNVVLTGISYNVSVGKGAARKSAEIHDAWTGDNGENSVVLDAEGTAVASALGGGGGGASVLLKVGGQGGGSGGGGAWVDDIATAGGVAFGIGGSGSDLQGNRGGTPSDTNNGGGGGGAAAAGGAKGEAGAGKWSDITGENVLYAQGGIGGKCDIRTPAADGNGPGFGGAGGNGNLGGAGGDGVVIFRFKKAYTNVKIQIPSVANKGLNTDNEEGTTSEFQCKVSALKPGEKSQDYTSFNQSARICDESGAQLAETYAQVVEYVRGTVTTNVSITSTAQGIVTNGLCHHKFTVKLKDGYSWADGSAYGSTGATTIDWRITDDFGKIDATIRVDKEVEWDENGSNATVTIVSHSTPQQNPKIPNVLFLGSLCNAHNLELKTVTNSLNAVASQANVDFYFYGGYAADMPKDPVVVGSLKSGEILSQTVINQINKAMESNNHHSMAGFYCKLNAIFSDATLSDKYDYICMEFDGSRMAVNYGDYEESYGWSTYTVDGYKKTFGVTDEIEAFVSARLKSYYDRKRVIWIVDDVKIAGDVFFPYYPNPKYQIYSSGWSDFSDSDDDCGGWTSYNGLVGLTSPENYPLPAGKFTICPSNSVQVGYTVSATVEAFLKKYIQPVAYSLTFNDKIKTNVGLTVTDFKVGIVTNGADYADKTDIPASKWIRLYEADIVNGALKPTYEDESMGINKNFAFEVTENGVTVSLTNLIYNAWTRLRIGLVDDGTFKTSYEAEWNPTTKQWEKNPNNGDAYVGMDGTEVYGEAATSVKWSFYAYPVDVLAENGESWLNGHKSDHLEFAAGYSPKVNYRGLPGYAMAYLSIDGAQQRLNETNITQYVFENIQTKHEVAVAFTNFVGDIVGEDSSFPYDGQAHVPDITTGDWVKGFTTKYTYSYDDGKTYYDYEVFTNKYRAALKDVAGSPYRVLWAVEVVQPGYGDDFLTPGFVKVYYGTNDVTITKRPLTVTAKYNYDNPNQQFIPASEAEFSALKGKCGYTTDGFVDGEGEEVLVGTIDYASADYVPRTQGQYHITPSGFSAANYEITFKDGTLSVGKGTMIIGEVPQSPWLDPEKDDTGVDMVTKIYDGVGAKITVDVNVPSQDYTIQYATNGTDRTKLTWLDFNPAFTNAGTNVVWYKVTSDTDSFYPVTNWTRVAILPRPILLRSASGSWQFNNDEHSTNDVKVIVGDGFYDFLAGEEFDVHTISYQQAVGSRQNLISCLPKDPQAEWAKHWEKNYDIHYEYGTLTVTPAPITIGGKEQPTDPAQRLKPSQSGVDAVVKMYDGVPTNVFVRIDVPSDGYPLDILYATSNSADPGDWKPYEEFSLVDVTDPDGQAVWYSVVDPAGNYVAVTNFQFVTITNRPATVTASDASKVYDGKPLTCAEFESDGFVAGEGVLAVKMTDASKAVNVTGATPVDNEIAEITKVVDGTKLSNYAITFEKGALSVTKRPIGLQSKNVGKVAGSPYVLQPGDVFVAEGSYAEGEGPFDYVGIAPLTTTTEPGKYLESASFEARSANKADVANYDISYTFGDLTLGNDSIYINGKEQPKSPEDPVPAPGSEESGVSPVVVEYDGQGHGLEVNVTHPATGYTVLYSTDGKNWSTDEIKYTDVAYAEDGSLVTNKVCYAVETVETKYYFVTNWSWVVVTPRKVTFTANDQKIGYGRPLPKLAGEFETDRPVEGDDYSVPLDYEAAEEYVPGDYEISTNGNVAITRGGKSILDCYDWTFVPGTLTVTQAVMTVADPLPVEKQWDGIATNITVTVQEGPSEENREIWYSLDGGETWTQTPDITEVGEYTVTFKIVDKTGRYGEYVGEGKVTISRRVIRVTANNYTRQINTPNPDPWPIEVRYLDTDSLMEPDDVKAIRGEIGVKVSYDEAVGEYENAAKPFRLPEGGYTIGAHYIVAQKSVNGEDGWVPGTLTITDLTKILYTIENYEGQVDGNGHTIRVKVTNDVSQVGTKDITFEWAWDKDGPWFTTKTTVKANEWADGIADVNVYDKTSDGGKAVWFRVTIDGTFTTETDYGYVILTDDALKPVEIGGKGPFGPDMPPAPTDPEDETDEVGSGVKNVVKTYDGDPTNVTVTITVPDAAEPYFLQEDGTWSKTNPTFTNAGTNKVWYKVDETGYYVVSNFAYVVIKPAPVTITSASETFVYNGSAQKKESYTVTSGKFYEPDTVTGKDYASLTDVDETGIQNTFDYDFSGGSSGNYAITQEYGTLKMIPAKLPDPDPDDDPKNPHDPEAGPFDGPDLPDPKAPPAQTNRADGTWSKLSNYDVVTVYDGAAHTFDVAALTNVLEGLKAKAVSEGGFGPNGYALAYSLTGAADTWRAEPFAFTDVAETPTSFWYRVDVPNFTNYVHAAGVVVTQRVSTITFTAKDKTYDGGTVATCASTNFADVVEGESFTLDTSTMSFEFDTAEVGTGKTVTADGYKDDLVAEGPGTKKPNYSFVFVPTATASITKDSFTFTLTGYDAIYDGKPHGVEVTVSPKEAEDEATISYSLDGGATWSTTNPTFTDVTNVTVHVKAVTKNYGEQSGYTTVNVKPRGIEFTCPTKSKAYDTTALTFGADEMTVGGQKYADGECFKYEFASITEVGEIASTVTCFDNDETTPNKTKVSNYTITVKEGSTLTVTPKKDTIGVASKSGEWKYDGNEHWLDEYDVFNKDKLIGGDEVEVTLKGVRITYPGVATNAIESVRIMRGDKDVTSSYAEIVATTGTLKVVNADFTGVSALDVSRKYDGKATNIVVTVKETLAGDTYKIEYSTDGENWSAANPTYADAGEYTVHYKVSAPYFNDYKGSATVKIDPREVTFTSPSSNAVYRAGIALSTDLDNIKISGDGLVNGERAGLAFSDPATITEEGAKAQATFTYAFDESKAKARNYTVTPVYGWLEIFPQGTLVVTAGSEEFEYDGDPQKCKSETHDGLKEGDVLTVKNYASSITYPRESPVDNVIAVSDIVIKRGEEDVTGEYTITCVPGTLTMKKLPLEGLVSAEDVRKVYDSYKTNVTVKVDEEKLIPGATYAIEYRTSDGEPWSDENPTFYKGGTDVAVSYQVTSDDYETLTDSAKVKITLRTVRVVSGSDSKQYDGVALTSHTATVDEGDGLYGPADGEFFKFTFSGSVTEVGSADNTFDYDVTNAVGTADLKYNYDFKLVPGKLTVTEATLPFTLEGFSGPYDGQEHGPELEIGETKTTPAAEYSVDGGKTWQAEVPKFTDVTNVTVVVRIKAKNYGTETVSADIKIEPRELLLVAPDLKRAYNGEALTFAGDDIRDGGQRYATGECFKYSDFASITEVGRVKSLFKYADSEDGKTKVGNYKVTIEPNRWLEVLPATDKIVVRSLSYYGKYDGKAHDGKTAENPDGYEVIDNGKLISGDEVKVVLDGKTVTYPKDGVVSNTFKSVKIMRGKDDVTEDYTNVVQVVGTLEVIPADLDDLDVEAVGIDRKYDGTDAQVKVTVLNDLVTKPANIVYSTDGVTFGKNPTFKDVCDETVTFIVTDPNFNPYTNSVAVTITKRTVCFESKNDWKFYDGAPLTVTNVVQVKDGYDDFADGEGVEKFVSEASITQKGECEAKFSVKLTDKTKKSNYTVETVFGKLSVYSTDGLTIVAGSQEFPYDGKAHTYEKYDAAGLDDGDKIVEDKLVYVGSISHPDQSPVSNWIRRESVKVVDGKGKDVTKKYGYFTLIEGELTMKNLSIDDRVSAEDVYKVYDGKATNITVTVDTKDLPKAAADSVVIHYSNLPNASFGTENLSFTKAGAFDVYYYVSASGCDDTKVKKATVTIATRNVKLASAGATKEYDGDPLTTNEVWLAKGEGLYGLAEGDFLKYECKGSQTDVGDSENTFTFAITNRANDASLKDNYYVTFDYGKLSVTAAEQDIEDPADGYDYVGMYDGAGHTIKTFTVKKPETGAKFYYSANGTDWVETKFYETNVCDHVKLWIKSVAPNYVDVVTNGCVTITNRPVTVTSASETFVYDGKAHSNATFTVTSDIGFVTGEGITAHDYATITTVAESGESGKENTFRYDFNAGTREANYLITQDYGMLTMEKAKLPDPDPDDDPKNPHDPEAGPFDGPDLPDPEVPPVPTNKTDGTWSKLSDYDWVGVYDGSNHTYLAQALTNKLELLKAAEIADGGFKPNDYTIKYSLKGKDDWQDAPFYFTDVTETPTSFWYRVDVPNFTNYIHAVGVVITQRVSTITFEAEDKVYDTTTAATCASTNFSNVVEGEGFTLDTSKMTFAFGTADVGENKTVTATGYKDDLVAATGATKKSNYSFVFVDTATASITEKETELTVVVTPEEFAWEKGVGQFPTSISVTDNGTPLTRNVDYTYDEDPKVNVGKYTVTVTGKGNYAGSSGSTNFWITAYVVTNYVEGVYQSDAFIGKVSGNEVWADCPEMKGYCIDEQTSVTNGIVRRVDDPEGLLGLTVNYEKDSNGDDVPDKYQRKLTFRVVNGWWDDDASKPAGGSGVRYAWITKFNEKGEWDVNGTNVLTAADIPAVGNCPFGTGFAKGGAWWPSEPKVGTVVGNDTNPLFLFGYNRAVGGGSGRVGGGTKPPVFKGTADITTFTYDEETGMVKFSVNETAYESGKLIVSMPLEATLVTVEGNTECTETGWKVIATKATDANGYVTVDTGDYKFFRITVR